jgi:hypothetical protein
MGLKMNSFGKLVIIMDAQYQKEKQLLQLVVQQELALRSKVEKLQRHANDARNLGLEDNAEVRALGADIVWEKWLERARAQMNLELAKVLAKKELHLVRVRKSFGKLQVATAKSQQLAIANKKRSQIEFLNEIISQEVSKRQ